ncbi:MAG: DUF4968 domain-containing protein, partial [Spirochaetia bacterium]|nr:DUF4968 domain-containing protein [Spirochaetia bacterium]
MNTLIKQDKNSIYYKHQRITFLTESLIRIEYSPSNKFIDEKTQMVVNRDFDLVDLQINLSKDYIEISSKSLFLESNGEELSSIGLKIT